MNCVIILIIGIQLVGSIKIKVILYQLFILPKIKPFYSRVYSYIKIPNIIIISIKIILYLFIPKMLLFKIIRY